MSHERDSGVYYTGEVTRIATNKHKNKFNVTKIENSRMGSKYDKTLKKVQCVRISSRFRNEFDSIAYFGIDWVPECRVRDSGIVWGISLTGNAIALKRLLTMDIGGFYKQCYSGKTKHNI